jgi:hypothetical protein
MRKLMSVAMLVSLVGQVEPSAWTGEPAKAKRAPKQALQELQDLIGSWKGTGVPSGTRDEKQKGFWTETVSWEWQFKDKDAWFKVAFDKSKHFTGGDLRYLPDKDVYQLTLATPNKESLIYTGQVKDRILTLEREDDKKKETHRLVINMLHEERFLYRGEIRREGKTLFTRLYQVGATKEGVQFAAGDGRPECIVSGGLGTMAVSYMGKTYYVCCSGCRTEFNAEPLKYINEYEAKKNKKK